MGLQSGYMGREQAYAPAGTMMGAAAGPNFNYPSAPGYGGGVAAASYEFSSMSQLQPPSMTLGGGYSAGGMPMASSQGHPPTIGGAAPLSTGRVTSNTSSKDPQALRSRVFVGNLNTAIVTREQLHSIYSPFGEILAISMHKGYAFVQFAYESEARNAVTFTDGSPLCGKKLDVTISSEPKTQSDDSSSGHKRSASVSASARSGPDAKKPRYGAAFGTAGSSTFTSVSSNITVVPLSQPKKPTITIVPPGKMTDASGKSKFTDAPVTTVGSTLNMETLAKGDDIHICGTCRQLYTTVDAFNGHKRACAAPSVVKTADGGENGSSPSTAPPTAPRKAEGEPASLCCFICHAPFDFSWPLLVHMQETHSMKVYEVGVVKSETGH